MQQKSLDYALKLRPKSFGSSTMRCLGRVCGQLVESV